MAVDLPFFPNFDLIRSIVFAYVLDRPVRVPPRLRGTEGPDAPSTIRSPRNALVHPPPRKVRVPFPRMDRATTAPDTDYTLLDRREDPSHLLRSTVTTV